MFYVELRALIYRTPGFPLKQRLMGELDSSKHLSLNCYTHPCFQTIWSLSPSVQLEIFPFIVEGVKTHQGGVYHEAQDKEFPGLSLKNPTGDLLV